MKIKKIISVLLAIITLIVTVTAVNVSSISAQTTNNISEKNLAWLSDFYVRESSTDLSKKKMVPKGEGNYKKSLETFKAEVKSLKKACNISLKSLSEKFDEIINKLYELISDTGLAEDYTEMKNYLISEYNIVYPDGDTYTTPIYTAVVYCCLKYDIVSSITGTPVVIPSGTTIDRAIAIIVANVLGEELPDNITSIEDYAVETIKRILKEYGYEISENYTPDDIVAMYKIMICEQQGYIIENKDIKNYTEKDFKHLDGSYYAAIIKEAYKVSPTPEDAYNAVTSSESDDMAKLILSLMIESKGESTKNDKTLEQLFNHACKLGFFDIDNGFYSNIYDYDVYLKYNCDGVWVAAYAYAAKLGENELNNVKITVNGEEISNGKSYYMNLNGDETKVVVSSTYNNNSKNEKASYTFTIHNGDEKLPENVNIGYSGNKGNNIPNFTLPDTDGSGKYSPLENEYIFNPYDLNTIPGSLGTDEENVNMQLADTGLEKSSGEGLSVDFKTGLVIALCVAGGVFAGAFGVIGVLAVIKKKKGSIL